jgi:hypothetical protein
MSGRGRAQNLSALHKADALFSYFLWKVTCGGSGHSVFMSVCAKTPNLTCSSTCELRWDAGGRTDTFLVCSLRVFCPTFPASKKRKTQTNQTTQTYGLPHIPALLLPASCLPEFLTRGKNMKYRCGHQSILQRPSLKGKFIFPLASSAHGELKSAQCWWDWLHFPEEGSAV